MLKEDIPYLELPHENPYSTRDGARHVLDIIEYSFKNQLSIHEK